MTTVKTLKRVTEYIYRNNHYTIVRDEEKRYWAIEDRYFTEDGVHLKKEINGLQGHINKSLNGCLNSAAFEAEYEYRAKSTKDKDEALYSMINFCYPFKNE